MDAISICNTWRARGCVLTRQMAQMQWQGPSVPLYGINLDVMFIAICWVCKCVKVALQDGRHPSCKTNVKKLETEQSVDTERKRCRVVWRDFTA